MSPIDAAAPDYETPQHEDGKGNTQSRYDYPYGISVNRLGVRFFDEGEAQHSYTYAKTGRAVLGQPDALAYQLYDQKGLKLFRYPHHQASYHEAASIAALAPMIGIEPAVLTHTVEEFNRAVDDTIPFDQRKPDGKATRGLAIPKSNWAQRLDAPPFRAYPVTGGITFTFGGLAVTRNGQVLNSIDQPIRGLFASGDIVGLFFHNYPSFTGQTRNAVFSRLAGRAAVETN
jgi:tricarballylate dehydrogenase